jgi:hypothetical protein
MSILLVLSANAQTTKPNFSGHWVLDKTKSDFGAGPHPLDVTEDIDHQEPKLVITTTTKQADGEDKRSVKYTTDDTENTNLAGGHEMKTKSHWEGSDLVTVVRGDNGLQLREVRKLSKDGRTQTVETDFGMGKQTLVLTKK